MQPPPLRTITAIPLSYALSVPTGDAPAAGWPLLCFLHGYDEAAPFDLRQAMLRHGPLRNHDASLVRERFVVLAPQLPIAGDLWNRHANAVAAIVDTLARDYPIDIARRYLTGFSFGGNGVFDLAASQPDRWAALWSVDPTRVPPTALRTPLWLSFGEVARYRKDDLVLALRLQPYDETAMQTHVYLDQGQDHVRAAALAYADPRIYRWLLSQRR